MPQSKKVLSVDDEEIFAENHCSCVLMTAHPADTVVAGLVPPKSPSILGNFPKPN